ncbi:hypothetical protein GOC40_12225 [Sinorhizobium meliloti]|nr:hypothetical protein [Sinorhizobium meliloti]
MSKGEYIVECRSQGISKSKMTRDELNQWFDEEISFWNTLPGIDENVILYHKNLGPPNIVQAYRNMLTTARAAIVKDNDGPLRDFLAKANDLKAIIAHGGIGEQLRRLFDSKEKVAGQRLAIVMSSGVLNIHEDVERELSTLSVVLRFNPFILSTSDTVSAKAAMTRSIATEEKMRRARKEFETSIAKVTSMFNDFAKEKSEELDELHTQYENHLLLQGPSRHWKRVADTSWRYAAGAFIAFIVMLAAPTAVIAANWGAVSSYLDHVVEVSKGGISLAAIAVFTVPVLAYGWLLKHVSRVFTQNLVVNSDAEHRRVMAVTFLGLAKRKSVGMSEQDRALILNALFRPSPNNPHDDGPPSGLLDLFKK